MRLPRVASVTMLAAAILPTACSSNSSSRASPTTAASTTSTRRTHAEPTTVPPRSSTSTASTSTSPGSTGPRIVSLTGPPTPVPCNAPTSVELHWETRNANRVELRINGGSVFATYADGRHDELVPLACDGTPQTYQLTARAADGRTATKKLRLAERAP